MLLRPKNGARALDLACGAGRNAFYLADLSYAVDAWDISDVGLALLRQELERRPDHPHISPRQVDLDTAELPVAHYDLVLDAYFLDRRLFGRMQAALRADGLLVVHTLMRRRKHEDRTPRHLLEPGELRRSLPGLDLVEYLEDDVEGWARLIGRSTLSASS